MKYAIIKTGSSQLRVAEGDTIKVLGQTQKPSFEVLFFSDGSKIYTGKADLKNVKISSSVLGTGKSRKISVGRFKAKSRYDKTRGFREQFTQVTISKISFGAESAKHSTEGPKAEAVETKEVKEKAAAKKTAVKKETTKKVAVKKPVANAARSAAGLKKTKEATKA